MRSRNYIYILALALIPVLWGCTKQRDLYVISSPLIKIKCDWSRARLEPDRWTLMLYGDQAARPKSYLLSRTVDTLQIAPDNYRTLLVNGSLQTAIDFVAFRNTGSFDTFEAYATVERVKPGGEIVVNEPDTLAGAAVLKTIGSESKFTARYKDGHLQPGDQRHYVLDSLEYVPCRLVYRINVVVTIENINYLLPERKIAGEVRGLAGGVLVASRMPTHAPVTYSLSITNNNPSSATVGTIETAFATFGPPLDLTQQRSYIMELAFILKNSRIYKVPLDVSDQVEQIAAQIKDRIDRGVCDAGLDLELRVTVTLPDPSPNTGDIWVDPWGDEENEDVFL